MADPVPAAPPTQFTLFADTLAGLDPALMKYFEPAIQEVRDRRVAVAAAAVGGPLPGAAAAVDPAAGALLPVGGPLPADPLPGAADPLPAVAPLPGAAAAAAALPDAAARALLPAGGPLPAAPLPGANAAAAAALPDAAAGALLPVGGPLPGANVAAAAALPDAAVGGQLPGAVHGGPAAGALLPDAAGGNAAAAEEGLREIEAEIAANIERSIQALRNDNTFQPALKAEITRIRNEIHKISVEEESEGTMIAGVIPSNMQKLNNFLTANFVNISGRSVQQTTEHATPGLSKYITLITRLRDTTPDAARMEQINSELDYLPSINIAHHTITFRKYRIIRNSLQRIPEEITFDYTNRATFNFNHTKLENLSYRDILESFESVKRLVLTIYNNSNKKINVLIRRIISTIETLKTSVREEIALQARLAQKEQELDESINIRIAADDAAQAAIAEFTDALRGPTTDNPAKKAIVQAYHDLYAYYTANPTRTDVRDALRAGFPRIMQIYQSIEETRPLGFMKSGRNGMQKPKMAGGLRTRRKSRSHKRKTLRKVK